MLMKYFKFKIPFFVVCALFCMQNVWIANSEANLDKVRTVAIVPGVLDKAPSELLLVKMEEALSHLDQVRLLERAQVYKVLDERELRLSGLVDDNRALGGWLSASLMVFVEKLPDAQDAVIRIRVVESETGIIMSSALHLASALTQDINVVIELLQKAIDKNNVPLEDRVYVSVLGFESEELGTSLDGLARALTLFVTHDLASLDKVIVLEREQVAHLNSEQEWMGLNLRLKGSGVLIEGGLSYSVGKKEEVNVDVVLRPTGGGDRQQMSLVMKPKDVSLLRQGLLDFVRQKLDIQSSKDFTANPKQEGAMFLSQIPFLMSIGDYETAVQNAEVAYALLGNQESRYWAARAWYLLGRTFAKDFKTTLWHPGWSNVGYSISVAHIKREDFYVNITRDSSISRSGYSSANPNRGYDLPNDDKVRALLAISRCYNFIHQMLRVHIDQFAQGQVTEIEFPDPLKSKILPTLPVYGRDDRKLTYEVLGESDSFMKYYEQIIDMELEQHKMLSTFYGKHYDHSKKAKYLYWTSWMRRKNTLNRYYGSSDEYLMAYMVDAVKSFILLPKDDDIKFDALRKMIKPHGRILDKQKKLYGDLLHHKSPDARKMGKIMFKLLERKEESRGTWSQGKTQRSGAKKTTAASVSKNNKSFGKYKIDSFGPIGKQVSMESLYINWSNSLFGEGKPIMNNICMDGTALYYFETFKVSKTSFKVVAHKHDFSKSNDYQKLGEAIINVRKTDPKMITACAVGKDYVYVGTPGGLIVVPKVPDEKLNVVKVFTEDNGLADNRILSLAYHGEKVYIGVGPTFANEYGWVGKSGLVEFDPNNARYKLIATNGAFENVDGLNGGGNYQISAILTDKKRNCLWLAVTANQDRSGIWRYDLNTKEISLVAKEHSGIKAMAWSRADIIYPLYNVGLVHFDPDTKKKTWLASNVNAEWHKAYNQKTPLGVTGEPTFGFHTARLWPMAYDQDYVFAVTQRGSIFELYSKKNLKTNSNGISQNAVPRPNFLTNISHVIHNPFGVWVVNDNAQVYLLRRK